MGCQVRHQSRRFLSETELIISVDSKQLVLHRSEHKSLPVFEMSKEIGRRSLIEVTSLGGILSDPFAFRQSTLPSISQTVLGLISVVHVEQSEDIGPPCGLA